MHILITENNSENVTGIPSVKILEQKLRSNEINITMLKSNCKEITSTFNEVADALLSEQVDCAIISLKGWREIDNLFDSRIQLCIKPVAFYITGIQEKEVPEFNSLWKKVSKFWHIHLFVDKLSSSIPTSRTLHAGIPNAKVMGNISQRKAHSKRKYIGWRHNANELRQKIKFNKDLIKYVVSKRLTFRYSESLSKEQIPKVIHYCWFGGNPLPEKVERCIKTWSKYLPEYTIKCWNEDNFPIDKYPFAVEALKLKKWAFVSDVARLHALYYEGGIYLDTDVEMIKGLDDFLDLGGFTGYESLNLIAMACIGFKKNHPWVKLMLDWYGTIHCDEDYSEIANTKVVSKITRMFYHIKLKGQDLILPDDLHVFPRDFFSPELETESWKVTKNTYCIHHFTGLW